MIHDRAELGHLLLPLLRLQKWKSIKTFRAFPSLPAVRSPSSMASCLPAGTLSNTFPTGMMIPAAQPLRTYHWTALVVFPFPFSWFLNFSIAPRARNSPAPPQTTALHRSLLGVALLQHHWTIHQQTTPIISLAHASSNWEHKFF